VAIQGYVVWFGWPLVAALAVFLEARRPRGLWHALGVLVLATYAMWIASVAFFPMPLLPNEHFMEAWDSLNLVPFRTIVGSFRDELSAQYLVRVHGGNLLLLMPYTLLGPLLWPTLRRWWKALLLGSGISLGIELGQLVLSLVAGGFYRSVDIDDVILNTAGAMLGYGLYACGRRYVARRQRPLGVS
jgi:glycopeptide antibiotics resistance protein